MKIKICGVTHPDDAAMAVESGADYIGLIFAPGSKRFISIEKAKAIAEITTMQGATPVGVFTEHDAQAITTICAQTGITTVQLHGHIAKQALKKTPKSLNVLFAIEVNHKGKPMEEPQMPFRDCDYLLYDFKGGGTGITFDWNKFRAPVGRKWILAGGLTPENVERGIGLFNPDGVDVSTGVEIPGTNRKDPKAVKRFIEAVISFGQDTLIKF